MPPVEEPSAAEVARYAELPDLATVSVPVDRPCFWGAQTTVVKLAPTASPPPVRGLIAGTEPFTAEWIAHWHTHRPLEPTRDIRCYFAADAVIAGTGEIWLDGRLATSWDLMPDYVYKLVLGLPERGEALISGHPTPLRIVDEPCVVMPGASNVFGHFLIETMFYVATVQNMLRGTGLLCRWLVSSRAASWHVKMLVDDLGVPTDDLVRYDPYSERVRLRQAILPAMIHRDDGFHPIADGMVDELLHRIGTEPIEPRQPRLFLIRQGFHAPGQGRDCANEAALVAHACAVHGFAAVSPQSLPWRRQVALMRQAEIVVGLFGSALHGTIFSPPGTRVGCIGFGNMTQTEIANLRGQRIAYLTEGVAMTEGYTVDEDRFAAFLAAVCDGPEKSAHP